MTVQEEIARLEHEKLQAMQADDIVEWTRLSVIQQLTREQLADDAGSASQRDRIGRTWAEPAPIVGDDSTRPLWSPYATDQEALARGLAGFLDQVTEKQRDCLRLIFYGGDTEREAAARLGLAGPNVHAHVVAGLKVLGKLLRRAFVAGDPPEPEDPQPLKQACHGTVDGHVYPSPIYEGGTT